MKKRISLTLEEGLLKKADRLIGKLADSRSSVFDVLVEKALLTVTPKTAVILVGSKKESLILKDFKGKKVLDYHLENLKLAGVIKFIFVGEELNIIREYVREKEGEFLYVNDKESGTGGALKQARHLLTDTFFLVYGDTISTIDYADMYRFHVNENTMVTVGLTTSNEPRKYGIPEIKGTRVVGFKEKPKKTKNYIVSSGSFVVEPDMIELISKDIVSLEKKILPKLASLNQLAGYMFSGNWLDMGHEMESNE